MEAFCALLPIVALMLSPLIIVFFAVQESRSNKSRPASGRHVSPQPNTPNRTAVPSPAEVDRPTAPAAAVPVVPIQRTSVSDDSDEDLYETLAAAILPFAEATSDLLDLARNLAPQFPQLRVWIIPLGKFLQALTNMPKSGCFQQDLATYAERLEEPTRNVVTIGEATAQTMPAQVRAPMLRFVNHCRGLSARLADMRDTLP